MSRSLAIAVANSPTLTLFGGLVLNLKSGLPPCLRTRRARQLLAMLAVGPVAGQPRETLIEALWPDADPDLGRGSLATELCRLREVLQSAGAGDWIVKLADRIGLAAEARAAVDAVQFEAAVRAARTAPAPAERVDAAAIAERLYTGEFMAGEMDAWSMARREFYAAQRIDVLLLALEVARGRDDRAEVIRLGRIIIEADPLLESVHRDVMRACMAIGDRGAALAAYRRLETALRTELDVAPMPETRALRDLLSTEPNVAPLASGPVPQRLGELPGQLRRLADELDALAHCLSNGR